MLKQNINMTEQVLIGSLLGDGNLKINKRGINAMFREIHGIKQKEYLLFKKRYLKCFYPEIKEGKIFDNRTNKHYARIVLWTKTHPILTEYFNLFYSKGKKNIPKEILNKVGPLALAIWYCDDGSFGYINQNGKIATYLSYEDNKTLVEFLKEKFNIRCTINKDGKSHHLYFSVKEIKKFLNLIKDYVPKCMNYKLGPLVKDNIVRLNEENLKRREKDKIRYYKYMNDPIRRELIRKQHRENHIRRMQNPEYRRKYYEYQKAYNETRKQSHIP